MILSGIRSQLAAESTVTAVVPASRIFIAMARREAQAPYIVIHDIGDPPAETTFDGSTVLREGMHQFDCYADNQVDAKTLSRIVEAALRDRAITLPDNTVIQFIETTITGSDSYEIGGSSFIFRSFFRMSSFFTEP